MDDKQIHIKRYEAIKEEARIDANFRYTFELLGNLICEDSENPEGPWITTGLARIFSYLHQKYGHNPAKLAHYSTEQLLLLLEQELHKYTDELGQVDIWDVESPHHTTATARLYMAQAAYVVHLNFFGDQLHKCGKSTEGGMPGVYEYILKKHGWPLHEVTSLSYTAMWKILSQEMDSIGYPEDIDPHL